jgi:hypothetical protein
MFMARRDYSAGGLVIVTVYFQGVLYITLEDYAGDQPLPCLRLAHVGTLLGGSVDASAIKKRLLLHSQITLGSEIVLKL